jgi:DNA polymerase-3 subunit epsilon
MIAFDKDDEEILLWKHKGVKVDKILETEPLFQLIQMQISCCTKKVLTAIKLRKKLNNKLS